MIHVCLVDVHSCVVSTVLLKERDLIEKFLSQFDGKEVGVCQKIYYSGNIYSHSVYGDELDIFEIEPIIEFLKSIQYLDSTNYEFISSIDKLISINNDVFKNYTIVIYKS